MTITRTHTHTYVELEVSEAAYKEIRAKLFAAGYLHCFDVRDCAETGAGPVDMTGIAVIPQAEQKATGPTCAYVYPGGAVCGYREAECMHNGSPSLVVPQAGRHDFCCER